MQPISSVPDVSGIQAAQPTAPMPADPEDARMFESIMDGPSSHEGMAAPAAGPSEFAKAATELNNTTAAAFDPAAAPDTRGKSTVEAMLDVASYRMNATSAYSSAVAAVSLVGSAKKALEQLLNAGK